jgi:hypothetical protein
MVNKYSSMHLHTPAVSSSGKKPLFSIQQVSRLPPEPAKGFREEKNLLPFTEIKLQDAQPVAWSLHQILLYTIFTFAPCMLLYLLFNPTHALL